MTRREYVPRPYQPIVTDFIVDVPRCALWVDMGLGKTCSTLTAIDALYLSGAETRPTLVLGPKRVAQSVWSDEAAKWAHLRHIDVSVCVGSEKARIAALARDTSVYTINYDNLPWLVKHLGNDWPFGIVVSDESTRLKSYRGSMQTSKNGNEFVRQAGGMRARALGQVAHKRVRRFIELTGTPSPNGLKDLWGQAWFLDAGIRLGRTYESFMQRWFQAVPGGDGYSQVKPLPFAQEQIQDRLRDICISVRTKDYFDIAEPIVNNIYVDLPGKARQLYNSMEKKMYAEIAGSPIEAFNAAAKSMKCLQFASGTPWVERDTDKWSEIHTEKIQALEDIVEEAAGMPVLVAYQWIPSKLQILMHFPKARELKTRQDELDWRAGKIPLLVAHPKSCGHGLNLQDGGNVLAYYDHWWDLEEYMQILERIGPVRQMQSGYDRPVYVHHIIARDTVDDDVMCRRESKRAPQDILLDSTRRRAA